MNIVLDFLTALYETGIGFSALNTARSALSSVVVLSDRITVGSHHLVCRFMKGVSEIRPSKPRYCETWDVSLLLQYFHDQEDNKKLAISQLTQKLCALLLLLSGQRVQTIHLIKLSCVKFHEGGCEIRITDRLKQFDQKKNEHRIQFPKFVEDEKLCVVSCLDNYVKRTAGRRKGVDNLLLCYKKPYGPASKGTLCRWLKTVMHCAGIDVTQFAAHSFRSASTSAAHKLDVPLDTILQTAGWSNAETFRKFYNRPVKETPSCSFANSILNYFVSSAQKDNVK